MNREGGGNWGGLVHFPLFPSRVSFPSLSLSHPHKPKVKKTKWIKIPIEVCCIHKTDNPDVFDQVEMKIEVDDTEVPSYIATCPKCGKTIIISFGAFLYEEKEMEEERVK